MLTNESSRDHLSKFTTSFNNELISVHEKNSKPSEIGTCYSITYNRALNPEHALKIVSLSLEYMIINTFISTKSYLAHNNLLDIARKESWYHFARYLRNYYSHGRLIHFDRSLPIQWKNINLSEKMIGSKINLRFFDALQLNAEISGWISRN